MRKCIGPRRLSFQIKLVSQKASKRLCLHGIERKLGMPPQHWRYPNRKAAASEHDQYSSKSPVQTPPPQHLRECMKNGDRKLRESPNHRLHEGSALQNRPRQHERKPALQQDVRARQAHGQERLQKRTYTRPRHEASASQSHATPGQDRSHPYRGRSAQPQKKQPRNAIAPPRQGEDRAPPPYRRRRKTDRTKDRHR